MTATKPRRFTKRERATFCTEWCRDAWECDRSAGLIRPPFKIDGQLCPHNRACDALRICRYCEARLHGKPAQHHLPGQVPPNAGLVCPTPRRGPLPPP